MDPTVAQLEPVSDTEPVVDVELTTVEPNPGPVRPHPAEWYDTPEFRRQLLLHFQKATRKAVATNPTDLPG